LVVEDEDLFRGAVGPLLEADGYDVSFAENGREALRWLYSGDPPEIIFGKIPSTANWPREPCFASSFRSCLQAPSPRCQRVHDWH
jgi:hypothetical protein